MSSIVVRVLPETWKNFRQTSAASRQMRRLLRLAVQMLLQRIHPVNVSIDHIRLQSYHNRPLVALHYLPGRARPRAGRLSPPQWLVRVRAPVAAVLCVTPRKTTAGVTLTVHALAPEALQTALRMLEQALEIVRREAANNAPAAPRPVEGVSQPRGRRPITFRRDLEYDADTEGSG